MRPTHRLSLLLYPGGTIRNSRRSLSVMMTVRRVLCRRLVRRTSRKTAGTDTSLDPSVGTESEALGHPLRTFEQRDSAW